TSGGNVMDRKQIDYQRKLHGLPPISLKSRIKHRIQDARIWLGWRIIGTPTVIIGCNLPAPLVVTQGVTIAHCTILPEGEFGPRESR
ncbi:MAG: hypothetical protein AAGE85_08395, partial [Pseudomonadota bacterium]